VEIPEHVDLKLLREEVMKCPMCGKNSLKVSIYSYNMPMIGPVIFVVGKCSECGYKFVDIKTWEAKGDQRIELKVEDEKDLNALVLRSSTASVEIPELQAELTPGPSSQGFLTTVEGVLRRFKDILEYLCRDAANEKERAECEKRLQMLNEMLEGKRKFTLVIRDPEGYSKIASEKAKEEIRKPEEQGGMRS